MKLVDTYNLMYNGASAHEILAVGKAQILGNTISRADSRKVADWALERLNAFQETQEKYAGRVNVQAKNVAGRYIEHIHRNCADEIRSNFEQYPVISDEEAAKILFEKKIKDELDSIPAYNEFTIQL